MLVIIIHLFDSSFKDFIITATVILKRIETVKAIVFQKKKLLQPSSGKCVYILIK